MSTAHGNDARPLPPSPLLSSALTDAASARAALDAYGIRTPKFSLEGLKTYARCVNCHDFDTITVVLPVAGGYYRFNVRLLGIDSPEIGAKDPRLRAIAMAGRLRIVQLATGDESIAASQVSGASAVEELLGGRVALVWLECAGFDKWGRPLAEISSAPGGQSFSRIALEEHLAYAYRGDTKLTEAQQLRALMRGVQPRALPRA